MVALIIVVRGTVSVSLAAECLASIMDISLISSATKWIFDRLDGFRLSKVTEPSRRFMVQYPQINRNRLLCRV